MSTPTSVRALEPESLAGLWRRETLQFPDGAEDRTTLVLWGQTHSLYVDLRIPADRPQLRGRRSFADFEMHELLRLAQQKGFAGHIELNGDLCTWIRYIDYQPNNGRPDRGRLRLDGDTLYEEGDATAIMATAYREIYRRNRKARRSIALRAVTPDGTKATRSADAILVIIDDRFLYARDRATALPAGESLRHLIHAAGDDRYIVHAYLDCEISFGFLDRGWPVYASTIPFREGQSLMPRGSVWMAESPGDILISGDEGDRRWRIIESSLGPDELLQLMTQGIGSGL